MSSSGKQSRTVASESDGSTEVIGEHARAAADSGVTNDAHQDMIVLRKEFWSNPDAAAEFDTVVEKVRARMADPQALQDPSEVIFQWCTVNGRTFWCMCTTQIVGGVPQLVCTEV